MSRAKESTLNLLHTFDSLPLGQSTDLKLHVEFIRPCVPPPSLWLEDASMSQSRISMIVQQQIGRADPSSQVLVVKPPKAPGKGFKVRTIENRFRNRVDMESVRAAYRALPYAYKFFWMIYCLSPVRTIVIISVYILQGLLPALRLRTGGDFVKQVRSPCNEKGLTL